MRPLSDAALTGSAAGANLAKVEPSRPRALIGSKYRVIRELGAGGMGVVVEVEHVEFPRRFALKWIRADLVNPEAERRFKQEAVVVGSLSHDNVVAISDFGRDPDGAAYMVMELLAGETLAAELRRRGALPIGRVVKIVQQVCAGLTAAHARGVVHRDIKPSNLFCAVRSDGTEVVKILDFGVAKAVEQPSVTATGSPVGTAFYMAPEQALNGSVDARTDVYALGVVAFEALTGGRVPHPGETFAQVMAHLLTKPALPLAEQRPDLPPGLVELVERALAHEPRERFATAAEFARALEPFAGVAGGLDETAPGRSVRAPVPRGVPDARDASATGLGRTSAPVVSPRGGWRGRAVASAVALAVLGGVWWQTRAAGQPAPRPSSSSGAFAAAPPPSAGAASPAEAASSTGVAPAPPPSADASAASPLPRPAAAAAPLARRAPAQAPVTAPATVTGRRGATFDTTSPY